jgi:hypothetical protein
MPTNENDPRISGSDPGVREAHRWIWSQYKERAMSKESKPISLTLPIYALPHNTDSETLTPLAQDLARDLEVMGVFDQREYEPAHVFALLKEKIDE